MKAPTLSQFKQRRSSKVEPELVVAEQIVNGHSASGVSEPAPESTHAKFKQPGSTQSNNPLRGKYLRS